MPDTGLKKFQNQDSSLLLLNLKLMAKQEKMEKRKLSKLKNLKNLLMDKLVKQTKDFHMFPPCEKINDIDKKYRIRSM